MRNESGISLVDSLITVAMVAIIAIGLVLLIDPDVSGPRSVGLWIGGAALVVLLLVLAVTIVSVFEDLHERKRRKPLGYAAHKGKLNKVQHLLQEGADVNARGDGGTPALAEAARNGHTHIVKVLLDHGADVDAKDDLGGTALTAGASDGHTNGVSTLIAKGADVNVKTMHGLTALMLAAMRHASIVKILLDAGADVNARTDNGRTALAYAEVYQKNEIVDLLKKAGAKE